MSMCGKDQNWLENFQKNFSFCYFCVIIVEVEKKHSRRSARDFIVITNLLPPKFLLLVYTQEKFTLKFYLINAIIKDKKIDVDFAPERILEKENAGLRGISSRVLF